MSACRKYPDEAWTALRPYQPTTMHVWNLGIATVQRVRRDDGCAEIEHTDGPLPRKCRSLSGGAVPKQSPMPLGNVGLG